MKWLHISDVHFANLGYSTEELRLALLKKLKETNEKLDFIIITGDCFYKNNADGETIPKLKDFIIQMGKCVGVQANRIYMCPGNHDVNRDDSKRNELVEECRKKSVIDDDSANKLMELGNQNFRSLFRAVKNKEFEDYIVIEPRNLDVRIASINSCLLSKDDTDYKKLRVCNYKLNSIRKRLKNDNKLNLLILHHGVEWLEVGDSRSLEHWIEDSNIDAVFCGHTHQAAVESLNDINREIYQFTAGALLIDDYAIPSFYIYESDGDKLKATLWSFSGKTEQWAIDNHHLRKFHDDGHHTFRLSRKEKAGVTVPEGKQSLTCEKMIRELNARYCEKFNTNKIYSNKSGEQEDFNAWKIVGSLAGVGVPYSVALRIATQVVDEITSPSFSSENILQSGSIKTIIYDNIIKSRSFLEDLDEYEIGIWASTYARHYNKDKGVILVDGNREEQITYGLIKSSLLKEAVIRITNNEIYYDKIYSKELKEMAASITTFVKSMGIFKIKKHVLLDLIVEYVSEPPHPWFVNGNRAELIEYHTQNLQEHLFKLGRNDDNLNPFLQIEAAYHLFAGYMTIYDEFTGSSETSPITILHHSLARINEPGERNLSMRKCMLIQLKKDLESNNIQLKDFINLVNKVYDNIVVNKKVTKQETTTALNELKDILELIVKNKKEEEWKYDGKSSVSSLRKLFDNAEGFIVKLPLQYLDNKAFFVKPYWDKYQRVQYNLGTDILVALLEPVDESGNKVDDFKESSSLARIKDYLSIENKKGITELVLFKDDFSPFTSDERNSIRTYLRNNSLYIKCIFIQKRDFVLVKENGWRAEFFHVVKISRA